MKLDIACGQRKQPGFKGIDLAGDADIIHDLNVYPWPIKKNSVTEIFCSHYVEHIPHGQPDGWWLFFDECYRICKKGAKLVFVHPFAKHDRAFWDPTHTRYISDQTWYYLDKNWREAQGLDHYPVKCDFEVVLIQGTGVDQAVSMKHHEHQAFARNHWWNVISDLAVELKKR